MVKICQTGLRKLNFDLDQKFPQAMDEVEIFFCQFPNPWALRVSGMGGYTSKCEKSQNHCTLLSIAWLLAFTSCQLKLFKKCSDTWILGWAWSCSALP
jgi:hypothetical protein